MENRKIIHVDMDAFYAAIEVRDHPELRGKPIAVGGAPAHRGVIATSNYEARKYGVKSAIASARAIRLCPGLIIVSPDMDKYKKESKRIQEIFSQFANLVEPVSLDEAYLDVTGSGHFNGSGTLIAREIRKRIFETTGLTASAGIAPNMFLAKVASDWNKPNGQYCIPPSIVGDFVGMLEVKKIPGVGAVTNERLLKLGVKTCGDLQMFSKESLMEHFGKFGVALYEYCRGMDDSEVVAGRDRKSLSVEETFEQDAKGEEEILIKLPALYEDFLFRLKRYREKSNKQITAINVKIKFSDFTNTAIEKRFVNLEMGEFISLFKKGIQRKNLPVRLIGLGVKFVEEKKERKPKEEANNLQLAFHF